MKRPVKRLLPPAILSAAALALVACGSGGDDDAAGFAAPAGGAVTASASGAGSSPAAGVEVGVLDVEGVGTVLADPGGQVLYIADEEADPEVLCTGSCEEFWSPAEAASDAPAGDPAIAGELGVAERPDGTTQLTLDGRRLYTFTLDGSGEAGGEGLSDTFDGQQFTWHAALATSEADSSTGSTESGAPTPAPAGGLTTEPEPASDVFDYPGY